ncbi:MAG: capping complex subunit for YIEGIA [Bacillaceae bacterium]
MTLENCILAVITTNKDKIFGSVATFYVKTEEELTKYINNLEAILDGIAHKLDDEVYIIVKH